MIWIAAIVTHLQITISSIEIKKLLTKCNKMGENGIKWDKMFYFSS